VNTKDVEHFRTVLGEGGVVTEADALEGYNTDWMGKFKGNSSVALRPKTVEDVSSILRYCDQERIPVVPQGGNTGLVGASTPVGDEVVLSLSLMNKVINFDEVSGTLVAEAGAILEDVDTWLGGLDTPHIFPVDLGAKGSCQLGGVLAAKAGGLRYVRYGSVHNFTLGVEVVKADGTVLNLLNTMRKCNSGIDLKHMFLGAEGQLGVITKVAIACPRRPCSTNVILIGLPNFKAVLNTFQRAKAMLGEVLSAVEMFDKESIELELEYLLEKHDPLDARYPFYMILETSGSNQEHDEAKLDNFLTTSLESEDVLDGVFAQDASQARDLWSIREDITVGLTAAGHVLKYDVSVPLDTMYDLVEDIRERVGDDARVLGYGHLGDSNLHLNVSTPTPNAKVKAAVEPFLYEWVAAQGGSISAEHGLGVMKNAYLPLTRSTEAIEQMIAVKRAFDPHCILNPFKTFPPYYASE
jgi:FAD/FMN-containing dehydrogenase